MSKVEIYSSDLCPFCFRAKALLKGKGIDFEEYVVDMNPDLRAEMRGRSGGVNTVPQIFIDGTHVGGCDEIHALDAKGALDPMLAKSA